jgi:hypothetical protein
MTLPDLRPDAMNQLSLITDSVESAGHVSGQLAGIFETHSFHRQGISDAELKEYTIVDIDLADSSHLSNLRARLKLRPSRVPDARVAVSVSNCRIIARTEGQAANIS